MALIEIDGLPFLEIRNGGSFHGKLLVYQGLNLH